MSVFFYGCITLDGYLADKNHNLDWPSISWSRTRMENGP